MQPWMKVEDCQLEEFYKAYLIVEGFGKVERGGNATSRDNCCCLNPFACNVKRNLFRLVCGCDWITLHWLHGQV